MKTTQKLLKLFNKSTFHVQPKTIQISLNNKALQGMKCLHISDFHINHKTPPNEIKHLVHTINNIDCDIVLFGGDIIDCKIEKVKNKLTFFQDIKHKTYWVSGNHDLVYGYHELKILFTSYGIECLDNQYKKLFFKNSPFVLWGLSDRFSKFFSIKRNEKVLVKTLQDIDLPKIFLSHQPKDYKFGIQSNSNIALFGHTHGGQIFPFHYLVRLLQPFLQGIHYKNDLCIYVNSGIGAWGLKYRFFSEPEITIIELS